MMKRLLLLLSLWSGGWIHGENLSPSTESDIKVPIRVMPISLAEAAPSKVTSSEELVRPFDVEAHELLGEWRSPERRLTAMDARRLEKSEALMREKPFEGIAAQGELTHGGISKDLGWLTPDSLDAQWRGDADKLLELSKGLSAPPDAERTQQAMKAIVEGLRKVNRPEDLDQVLEIVNQWLQPYLYVSGSIRDTRDFSHLNEVQSLLSQLQESLLKSNSDPSSDKQNSPQQLVEQYDDQYLKCFGKYMKRSEWIAKVQTLSDAPPQPERNA